MNPNPVPYLKVVSPAGIPGSKPTPLNGGGGGGTSDDMEARVAVLEVHMETVRRDVGELRTDMRDVRDRLKSVETDLRHLPSKGYIVTVAMAIMAFVAAVVTFQQQIQHLVHG